MNYFPISTTRLPVLLNKSPSAHHRYILLNEITLLYLPKKYENMAIHVMNIREHSAPTIEHLNIELIHSKTIKLTFIDRKNIFPSFFQRLCSLRHLKLFLRISLSNEKISDVINYVSCSIRVSIFNEIF